MDQGQEVGTLMDHFTKWEDRNYSLLSAAHHLDTKLLREGYLSDLGVIRESDLNWRATRLLLQHNHGEQVFHLIEQAYQLNPQSIHMWANKGVYYLSQTSPQLEHARAAKKRFDECLQDGELVRAARIQFAYWSYGWGAYFMHNMNPEITNGSLEIMRNEVHDNDKPEHHFMYMKTLQLEARNRPAYDRLSAPEKDRWLKDVFTRLIDQMIILARQQDPQYELEIWNLLMNTQYVPYCRHQLNLEQQRLMQISNAINNVHHQDPSKSHHYNMESCLQKMLAVKNDPDSHVEIHPQFSYRIGSSYLDIAKTQTQELGGKKNKLQQALEIVEPELRKDKSESRILGLQVASEANIHMWAVQYYMRKPRQAEEAFKRFSDKRHVAVNSVVRFLTHDYYTRLGDLKTDPEVKYLQNAYEQLNEMIGTGSSRRIASLRFRLGHPVDEIEAAFEQKPTTTTTTREHGRYKSMYHYGLFLEARGNYAGAITRYEEAVEIQTRYSEDGGDTYDPYKARLGIRRCQTSLRDRGDNNDDGKDVRVPRVPNLRIDREPNLGGGHLKSWSGNNPKT